MIWIADECFIDVENKNLSMLCALKFCQLTGFLIGRLFMENHFEHSSQNHPIFLLEKGEDLCLKLANSLQSTMLR